MTQALPLVAAAPGDLDARGRALYGAWLCGACLGATTMGLHHKLCHVLGGTFGLPHAETHTVGPPYALAYNAPAAPRAVRALSRARPRRRRPHALWALAGSLGAPRGLAELGLKKTDLAVAAEQAAGGVAARGHRGRCTGPADGGVRGPGTERRRVATGPYGPRGPPPPGQTALAGLS